MDSEQLGGLIDDLADALELYARQWCDEPEDVVQEAFVKLASLPETPLNPAAWLFRAVRNGAINAGIARRRRDRHEFEAATEASARWFEAKKAGRHEYAIDPDSAQLALSALPLAEREVIVAHLWGGLTFEQIADLAGLSTSSAHRLYQAGLKALRERLGVPCRTNAAPSRPIRS